MYDHLKLAKEIIQKVFQKLFSTSAFATLHVLNPILLPLGCVQGLFMLENLQQSQKKIKCLKQNAPTYSDRQGLAEGETFFQILIQIDS
jgi:hypothetical protein